MRAKKSLGQHFLASKGALNKIVDAANLTKDDIVLEIGPGKGVLTKELSAFAGKIIAVEKDTGLIPGLKEKFKKEISEGRIDIIEKDILDFDTELLRFYRHPYTVVANIPYYITGAILEKFLSAEHQPSRMVLLVQKEVAERIAERDGKGSLLSNSVKAYGVPRYVATVKRGSFVPPPAVDSAIIAIENISKKDFGAEKEEFFFSILKAGFAHKRKLLAANLRAVAKKDAIETAFKECGIDAKARAETLSIEAWKCLAQKLQEFS